MKRFTIPIFVGIIVFLLLHTHGIHNKAAVRDNTCAPGAFCQDVKLLMDTANHARADMEGVNINLWSRINDGFLSVKDLRQAVDTAIAGLGYLRTDYVTEVTAKHDFRQIAVRGSSEKGCRVDIVCQSLKYRDHNYRQLEETYMIIDIYGANGQKVLEEMIRGGYSSFDRFGVTPQASACATCAFNGELEGGDKDTIVDGVLKRLCAKRIEGIEDDGLLSISGYTPLINTRLPVEGSSININIALRYNEWRKKTFMWLGFPVINIPY